MKGDLKELSLPRYMKNAHLSEASSRRGTKNYHNIPGGGHTAG